MFSQKGGEYGTFSRKFKHAGILIVFFGDRHLLAGTQGRITMTAFAPRLMLPLVIDLDGTLLRSDLLLETGIAFVRHTPLNFFKPLGWLVKGKAALKEGLAYATDIDVSVLPYDPTVIELIRAERNRGRQVVLATASHHMLADRIAEHLQLFDQVLASDGERNLSADRKRDLLVELYGSQGFDYVGNSHDDISVWASARHAYVVNPESGVERRARAQ